MPGEPLEERSVACPYCGEPFAALLDLSAGDQRYVEDCPVCCNPIEFSLTVSHDGHVEVRLERGDD
ncbi:MAG: CPXCG motif-containing cysteine-rich protein [Gammaproteobacteria bacterium]|jgi:hypothetical protein